MLVACDGTWNDDRAKTNVWQFFNAYQKNAPSPYSCYLEGVGTETTWPGKIAGGLWGAGEGSKVDEAMAAIAYAAKAGDSIIDIVGFSRGAATALDLANRIHKETTYTIRFLGLWDTVAAFGVANLGWYFSQLTFGHQIYLPPDRILYACHAMALDERRPSFVVTRLHGADEVWFRGVHTDVGGSGAVGLSNIALRWMCRKAAAAGLPITEADAAALPIDQRTPPSFDDIEKTSFFHRTVERADLIHYTVGDPIGNPRESMLDETVASLVSASAALD